MASKVTTNRNKNNVINYNKFKNKIKIKSKPNQIQSTSINCDHVPCISFVGDNILYFDSSILEDR